MEERISVNLNEYHKQMFDVLYTIASRKNPSLTKSGFFLSMLEDKNAHHHDPRDGRQRLDRLESKIDTLLGRMPDFGMCDDPEVAEMFAESYSVE